MFFPGSRYLQLGTYAATRRDGTTVAVTRLPLPVHARLAGYHRRMVGETTLAGGSIDAIYYCPHNWEEGCECRKPKPGMLFQAQHDFNLDLNRTPFVGDDDRDAQAADAAGCPSVLVSEQKTLLEVVRELTNNQNEAQE